MKHALRLMLMLLGFQLVIGSAQAQQTIEEHTKKMVKYLGYYDLYWDSSSGKLFMKVDKFNEEFLMLGSLPHGVGSNDIGLDRGQLGGERIVKFVRSANKILLVQPNYRFRAETDNLDEQKAVELAFAQSVLWGFTTVAETDNEVLIDITNFCLQDLHGVGPRLAQTEQGRYSVDKSRSAIMIEDTKNFPKNTEIEMLLTYKGAAKGRYIRSVTPSSSSVSVRSHISFIELPDDQYKKRELDPRFGYFGISYMDYATPLGQPMVKQFIARHRLVKADPFAKVSDPVEPIVYYLDRGTPEPIRSALLDGARWWAEAFEAAGFSNAFKVEMLPEDADPMDVRYNVIQWVHRSTRGWSYGASVIDPRTGEIIKGHVSLGSLRVRQDYLIAEGLLSPYKSGKPVSKEMEKLALARLRQLSAHEVGHTIGLMHNFAASTNGRASVMDYPHPYIQLKNGKMDLSEAYDTKIGEWDKIAVTLGYAEVGDDEKKELNELVSKYIKDGYRYITDHDARPLGGAHPYAHLWDNGEDAVVELDRLMKVRKQAIDNFSEEAIQIGAPMAKLEEVFVPVYLMHRYQLEATSKVLGGLEYTYALRGDGQMTAKIVDGATQKKALTSLLQTLSPEALAIPERVLALIPPRPSGYPNSSETFKGKTGVSFDPLTAVENAAHASLDLIFHPNRAARLIEYHSRDAACPDLHEVIDAVLGSTWNASRKQGYEGEVQRTVERAVLYDLIKLASNKSTAEQVRAVTSLKLADMKTKLMADMGKTSDYNQKAHLHYAIEQINLFQQNPDQFYQTKKSKVPAGSPIGAGLGCGFAHE